MLQVGFTANGDGIARSIPHGLIGLRLASRRPESEVLYARDNRCESRPVLCHARARQERQSRSLPLGRKIHD